MTDRELLQAAARVVGLTTNAARMAERDAIGWGHVGLWNDASTAWNPLTNDADAFRLAVKLHMSIDHNEPRDGESWVSVTIQRTGRPLIEAGEEVYDDIGRPHSTRRAIVRAAAALDAGRMDGEKAQ